MWIKQLFELCLWEYCLYCYEDEWNMRIMGMTTETPPLTSSVWKAIVWLRGDHNGHAYQISVLPLDTHYCAGKKRKWVKETRLLLNKICILFKANSSVERFINGTDNKLENFVGNNIIKIIWKRELQAFSINNKLLIHVQYTIFLTFSLYCNFLLIIQYTVLLYSSRVFELLYSIYK